MPVMQFVNGAVQTTSVNAQIAADTSITPASASGFPANPQFTIRNRRTGELMLVTTLGATWTVTRGYAGTTAQAINAGDGLDYSLTREMLLNGFMVKLDEQALTGSVASVTFTLASVLPTGVTPRGLRIVAVARADNAVTAQGLQFRCNGDSGANYNLHESWSAGTGNSAASTIGMTFGRQGDVTGTSAPASSFGQTVIEVYGWSDTDKHKVFQAFGMSRRGTATSDLFRKTDISMWLSTAAITSILLYPTAGNFAAGSLFTLYGLP